MSDKPKKPQKLKARQPRGFVDRSPADIRAADAMMAKIREVYERYGFDPVETPMVEYTDALGKFLPDQDRPNEGVFSFADDDEQWLSLRYDLTAPLARHVAENMQAINLPYRTYRAGWVFRNEKPGPGRFRQFMQFDADTVGAPGVAADAEMAMMMADTMEALGIKRGDYVVRVNNRKVLDGVMEAIGVTDEGQKLAVLRAIDKLDKFGVEGVRLLLGEGRRDESGDFTKGAGLDEAQLRVAAGYHRILSYLWRKPLTIKVYKKYLRLWAKLEKLPAKIELGLDELEEIRKLVREAGYGPDHIRIDPSVVRGLEYYTGPVYECELTFPVVNEDGETVRFGSVAGGGRYDGLVKRFTGQDVPATGFSIGVSRLMTALKNLGKLDADTVQAPVLVTVMDRDTEALGRYQRFTQDLRNAGIRAEMFQGNPKDFARQLRYADRRGCPLAIIQGSNEQAEGVVIVKDLIEGRAQAAAIASNAEWRAARVAQVSVPVNGLVAKVKEMLAAQGAPMNQKHPLCPAGHLPTRGDRMAPAFPHSGNS
ncbi:MAG: histidine--tRNA ligase [Phyllobacteriaceae bacterium]|nr:histidine--tRNA ligase [Phyllobacteriaceae bacterium]